MATINVDTVLTIYSTIDNRLIGSASPFSRYPHPGTGNKWQGWHWDSRQWPTKEELQALTSAPTRWDPELGDLTYDFFQSGAGFDNSILLLEIMERYGRLSNPWIPKVHTGNFYFYNEEWYYFSDWHQTIKVPVAPVGAPVSVDLSFEYKRGDTIRVDLFRYIKSEHRYTSEIEFQKVVDFTGEQHEFKLNIDTTPFSVEMDDSYWIEIGETLQYINPSQFSMTSMATLEHVAISDGTPNQRYHLEYPSVELSSGAEVYSYRSDTDFEEYTIIPTEDDFTSGDSYEVKVDIDKGLLLFGNYDSVSGLGAGHVPSAGSHIRIHYFTSPIVRYEPFFAQEYVTVSDVNFNPLTHVFSDGFLQLARNKQVPAYITLESTSMTEVGGNYETVTGNGVENLIATVLDIDHAPIAGAVVEFELLSPISGVLNNGSTLTTAITNEMGKAKVNYNPSRTAREQGEFVTTLSRPSASEVMFSLGRLAVGSSTEDVFLYQVEDVDVSQGIPTSAENGVYSSFLTAEGISGPTGTVAWEKKHREFTEAGLPVVTDDETRGRKRLILENRTTVDPHTGTTGAIFAPKYPTSVNDVGSPSSPISEVTYNIALPDPGTNDIRSYFLVGNTLTSAVARVFNDDSGKNLESNHVNILTRLSASMNGTFWANAASEVPLGLLANIVDVTGQAAYLDSTVAGHIAILDKAYHDETNPVTETFSAWFLRTRLMDLQSYQLIADFDPAGPFNPVMVPVTPSFSSRYDIPIGFRLKTSGLGVASVLDSVVYLDPN